MSRTLRREGRARTRARGILWMPPLPIVVVAVLVSTLCTLPARDDRKKPYEPPARRWTAGEDPGGRGEATKARSPGGTAEISPRRGPPVNGQETTVSPSGPKERAGTIHRFRRWTRRPSVSWCGTGSGPPTARDELDGRLGGCKIGSTATAPIRKKLGRCTGAIPVMS